MLTLPGLTDVRVYIATPEEEANARYAAAEKRWRDYYRNRSAIVLCFGKKWVRIPVGKMALDDLRRLVQAFNSGEEVDLLRSAATGENRTVWDRLMEVSDEQ